jgi:4,5:9,10-diseco-3-hydroxy-5,9,17-trioxoandrosta-1(10),2-diene-4-oate hydrolase
MVSDRYVNIDGVSIHYVVEGHGPPVLLIHGLGEFLEVWSRNIARLSEYFSVYAVDLPGHGLSGKPLGSYALDFTSEFIVHFMQALEIERANLVGHSLGAVVCLNLAISFPEKINKLVLVDAAGLSKKVPLTYRMTTLPVLGYILLGLGLFVNKKVIRKGLKMKRHFYNPNIVDEAWINATYKYLKRPERNDAILNVIRSNISLGGMYREASIADKLHLVKVPTLVVHGAEDKVIPFRYAQLACKLIPNARCEVIDECGHCPQIEKAAQFNDMVVTFLRVSGTAEKEPSGSKPRYDRSKRAEIQIGIEYKA